jgi:hypothetical protein
MLVKVELLNGKSKIIAVNARGIDELADRLQYDSLCWYKKAKENIADIGPDVKKEYLKSKGIKRWRLLNYKDELEIANKFNKSLEEYKGASINKTRREYGFEEL